MLHVFAEPAPEPTQEASIPEDDGQALAEMMAGILNDIFAAGGTVDEEQYGDMQQDAEDDGYELATDGAGSWQAKPMEQQAETFAESDWTQEKGPRGGTRWKHRGTGRIAYGKMNPGAGKGDRVKARSEAAKAAGPVDSKGLQAKIAEHAKAAGELSKAEQTSAKRSLSALKRHHGDAVEHRVAELVGTLEKAHQAATAKGDKAAALAVSKRIAAFGGMGRTEAATPAPKVSTPAKPAAPKVAKPAPATKATNPAKAVPTPKTKPAADSGATIHRLRERIATDKTMTREKVAGELASMPQSELYATVAKLGYKSKPTSKKDALKKVVENLMAGTITKARIDADFGPEKPAPKPAPAPAASSGGDEWTTTQVEQGTPESIADHFLDSPEGDGMSHRLDVVFDRIKDELPDLTPEKFKGLLQKAWDAKAVELHGTNSVKEISKDAMGKLLTKSHGGMDRVLAYAIVKDPKKLQSLVQSELLNA